LLADRYYVVTATLSQEPSREVTASGQVLEAREGVMFKPYEVDVKWHDVAWLVMAVSNEALLVRAPLWVGKVARDQTFSTHKLSAGEKVRVGGCFCAAGRAGDVAGSSSCRCRRVP